MIAVTVDPRISEALARRVCQFSYLEFDGDEKKPFYNETRVPVELRSPLESGVRVFDVTPYPSRVAQPTSYFGEKLDWSMLSRHEDEEFMPEHEAVKLKSQLVKVFS